MRFGFSSIIWLGLASWLYGQEIEPEEFRPGLITTLQDAKGAKVKRLEPSISLHYLASDAGHPHLSPAGQSVQYQGYLNVFRNGQYRFDAILRGKVTVKVNNQVVYTADAAEVKTIEGKMVALPSGIWPLEVQYERPAGIGRFELWWKLPQMPAEPIPHDSLGHTEAQRPADLKSYVLQDAGRFLFEENACIRCHAAGKVTTGKIVERHGPSLKNVGNRVNAGWLNAWLENPKKLRPHTSMPQMFSEDAKGAAEREAVTAYLLTLKSQPIPPMQKLNVGQLNQSVNRGRALFNTSGCTACHQNKPAGDVKDPLHMVYAMNTATGASSNYALGAVGSKLQPQVLQNYLRDPLALNPTSRMPHLDLPGDGYRDIANYLCAETDKNIPQSFTPRVTGNPKELIDLGKKLVTSKGCVNCHEFPKEVPTTIFTGLDAIATKSEQGCLSNEEKSASVRYSFSKSQKEALRSYLAVSTKVAGTESPTYEAKLAFKRFNCLNCHVRDGEGGLTADQIAEMQKYEKGENVDDVRPPQLTGVGHKMRTSWFKQVLTGKGQARPWMSMKMPQFGENNVGKLHEGIIRLEGAELDDTIRQVSITAEKIEAGRTIVGKTGLGCISCHDIAGIANSGTRGPDLSTTTNRVRYEWYRRWLEQPQRMAVGTRMPQVFVDGKSTFPSVLGGHGDAQAEAMWAYMSLGPNLPLPIGIEPPKGVVIVPEKNPAVFRTFMGESGNRSITVGFPEGNSVAFDANECRLVLAWAGNFLDFSKVWNDRGGNQAKLLGPRFWNAPNGNPFALSESQLPPDFAARAKDPAYGMEMPHLQLYQGKKKVEFLGYGLDTEGVPSFRYKIIAGDSDQSGNVTEKVKPIKASIAPGIVRTFTVEVPAKQNLWLNLGETANPRLFRGENETAFDTKMGLPDEPIGDRIIVLPEGDSGTALQVVAANKELKWSYHPKPNGGWNVLVKVPASAEATTLQFAVKAWKLPRIDPSIIKTLATTK